MTPDTTNLEDRIDKEKRQREDDLLLVLLALFLRARSHADLALRLGLDPLAAIRDVLLGNPALGLPGGAYRLAQAIAEAEAAGFSRALAVVNSGDVVNLELKPNATHLSLARQHMAKMLGTLQAKVYLAMGTSTGGIAATRRAVWEAFETWGYVDPAFTGAGLVHSATSKAFLLATVVETVIGFAWSGGWMAWWSTPEAGAKLKGFRFSAILDERTTAVCRACDGTKVPTDSPWIQTRTPPLHFNCRSVLLPIFRDFEPTDPLPWTPWPMPGFGHAQAISVGLAVPTAA